MQDGRCKKRSGLKGIPEEEDEGGDEVFGGKVGKRQHEEVRDVDGRSCLLMKEW